MVEPGLLVRDDGWVPKERYTGRTFFDGELERLWPRVWQIACREEEIPEVGDYVVYTIGDQSIVVVRAVAHEVTAFHNACLHRWPRDMGAFPRPGSAVPITAGATRSTAGCGTSPTGTSSARCRTICASRQSGSAAGAASCS